MTQNTRKKIAERLRSLAASEQDTEIREFLELTAVRMGENLTDVQRERLLDVARERFGRTNQEIDDDASISITSGIAPGKSESYWIQAWCYLTADEVQ